MNVNDRRAAAEVLFQRGLAAHSAGRLTEAATAYRQACGLLPQEARFANNLACLQFTQGDVDGARVAFERLTRTHPDFGAGWRNHAQMLASLGRPLEAEVVFLKGLRHTPADTETNQALVDFYFLTKQIDKAIEACQRWQPHAPPASAVFDQIGRFLLHGGNFREAAEYFRQELERHPLAFDCRSALLFAMLHDPDVKAVDWSSEARNYGRIASQRATKHRTSSWTVQQQPDALRVGLVSGDFKRHPVAHFLIDLLKRSAQVRLAFHAFPTLAADDEMTQAIRGACQAWEPIHHLPDPQAAELIRRHGVHVLIDLSGHTSGSRLPLFSFKPAPVQATWLGMQATTGVPEIDHVILDDVTAPKALEPLYSENVWRLPGLSCNLSAPTNAPVSALPALRRGYVTFGCFQGIAKVNARVLDAWARILAAVPDARLLLLMRQFDDPSQQDKMMRSLDEHGIPVDRVAMRASNLARADYLAAHAEVDVLLDTFPCNGGTTTCEALWMGVPTVTLRGEGLAQSRFGASILTAAGLVTDWVATDASDYVAKAIHWARNVEQLASLRAGLRDQVAGSPIFDADRFAAAWADMVWAMWRQHSANA